LQSPRSESVRDRLDEPIELARNVDKLAPLQRNRCLDIVLLPVRLDVESAYKFRDVGGLEEMAPQGVGYELLKDLARDTFAVFTNALAPRRAARDIVTPCRGVGSATAAADH
jgi:hypothetical protein